MPALNKIRLRILAPYLYIGFGLLAIFLIIGRFTPQRVGDGAEYYAMYLSWDTTSRPWMTPKVYDAYQTLYDQKKVVVTNLIVVDQLKAGFPQLKLGGTSDFNHFWFYSFLAFLCAKVLALISIKLQIHAAFLTLHYVLLLATTSIAYRLYKWHGVFIVFLMTFFSPVLWFIDKAHTELFTFTLVLSSIMLVLARKYMPAALFFALASTQNPSFAIIAGITFIFRLTQRRSPFTTLDVLISMMIVMAVLVHPAYYFFRFGVVTPQLLAGGALLGENLSKFYIWLIDPDIGLLTNWPLGLGILFLALCAFIHRINSREKINIDQAWIIFLVLFLCVNFYAHSSTTNINSGGTSGIARYALWYLPLFFPLLHGASLKFSRPHKAFYPLMLVTVIISAFSLKYNDPRMTEDYTTPTTLSLFIQSKFPGIYNPPSAVFLARYSGLNDGDASFKIKGVIGPDCRKLLLLADKNRAGVTSPSKCMFDPVKLNFYVDALAFTGDKDRYTRLRESDANNLHLHI